MRTKARCHLTQGSACQNIDKASVPENYGFWVYKVKAYDLEASEDTDQGCKRTIFRHFRRDS